MKVLKWILYIVLILVALVLIIPLFLPSTIEVTATKEVSVTPEQVFHNAATYTDRNLWDPWLETEPGAEFTLSPEPDYVGSTYTWNGKKIKTGRMMVDSVAFGQYIASNIWFGKNPEPSLVEWILEPMETGTRITWKFSAAGSYPIEKLTINLMKGSMLKSFEKGMENLAAYLAGNPPSLSSTGEITDGVLPAMNALVISGSATMEQIGAMMGELYGKIGMAIVDQELEMAGAPFTHYLNFDEETGLSDFLVGIPVEPSGKNAGDVKAKRYRATDVVQMMHLGPYDELQKSYEKIMQYIQENELDVTFEAFELYLTDPGTEPNVTKWQTLIAFPLK